MAINYGYFRHRLDASNDPKLQSLIDEMGIVALGYYWSLLELYGTAFNNNNRESQQVEIHARVLANTWRKRVDSCDLVLTKLQLSDLLVYTKTKNTYLIDIPNFLKYFGSYGKLEEEQTLKKRKEKKRKEIKRKENKAVVKSDYSLMTLIQKWNDAMGLDFGFAPLSPSSKMINDFEILVPNVPEVSTWDFIFEQCKKLNWLNGQSKSKWRVNLLWLLDYNNFVKVASSDQGHNFGKVASSLLGANPYE